MVSRYPQLPPDAPDAAAAIEQDPAPVVVCDGLHWFQDRSMVDYWCKLFHPAVQANANAVRELLQVNTLWRKPKLIKVPDNYDSIFQVG